MRAIRNGLEGAGIPVENSKGETGIGQEEINIRYAEALEMADRHSILKNGCKEIAHAQGKAIYLHGEVQLLAGRQLQPHPQFAVERRRQDASVLRQEGGVLDDAAMRSWVAGQLKYARDLTWFLAPYINSYKRFQVATWAPTKIIWSRDNRTAGFRLCGEGSKGIRIECRIGGADLNPYLAFAALIAAGLAGDRREAGTGEAVRRRCLSGARLPDIPRTLRDATETLSKSKMLKQALGADVLEHYVHTAKWEQFEYDRRITDWELHRGFERY